MEEGRVLVVVATPVEVPHLTQPATASSTESFNGSARDFADIADLAELTPLASAGRVSSAI